MSYLLSVFTTCKFLAMDIKYCIDFKNQNEYFSSDYRKESRKNSFSTIREDIIKDIEHSIEMLEIKRTLMIPKLIIDPDTQCPICYKNIDDYEKIILLHSKTLEDETTHIMCLECFEKYEEYICPLCR